MTHDERLAERVRAALAGAPELDEKRMFGGIGFMVRGNMACGILGPDIIVRIGPARDREALAQPGVRPFAMAGRQPMAGWVRVGPEGHDADEALRRWIQWGVDYALSLPAK